MTSQSSRSPLDDPRDWIARIALGDRQAFAKLFQRFAPKLKSYFLRVGFDDAEAEDLSQETLLRVWRCADQFDPALSEVWGWIYTIARNLKVDRFRKNERRPQPQRWDLDHIVDPIRHFDRADDARRVRGAVSALPTDQIAVVRLAYYAESPHSEIAQRLNVPLGTVKSRLRRAAARLRAALSE